MSRILVVDDSPVDRKLVGRMLKDHGDFELEFAVNGAEALRQIGATSPAVVITDLKMPEMDGMQLVRTVRQRFPDVPVILMTGDGSEQIAAEALRLGAADYVPKTRLAAKLVESIRDVLGAPVDGDSERRLRSCLRYEELHYELCNDVTLIPPLVGRVRESALRMGVVDATDAVRLGRALAESLRNAIFHGNLELPLGEFEDGEQLTDTDAHMIAALRDQSPYNSRRIHFYARITTREARFLIRDEGPGFNTDDLPDLRQDPAPLIDGFGRGMVLIRTFMDEVAFNASGNEITLAKRRATPDPGTSC